MFTDTRPRFLFMSCFFPKRVFINKKGYAKNSIAETVPCRKCIGCYLDYTNEWTLRCWLELQQHKEACFLTLTYDNDHLPEKGNLKRLDVQLFMKRLRRKIEPCKIRFYGCGEYGSKGQRPHYHIIIFGWQPDDLIHLKVTKRGEVIYRSPVLEKLWPFGFSSVGYATTESIKYCSKYLQKMAFNFDTFEVKPFTMCSTRIPIGYASLDSKQILSDKIYMNGRCYKLPRSFLKRLENEPLFPIEDIKQRREEKRLFYEFNCKKTLDERIKAEKNLRESIDFFANM